MAEICEKSLDNLPTFQGFFSFTFLFVTNAEKAHVKLIHTFSANQMKTLEDQ